MDDRRSSTGYVFTTQGGAISWCTRKQATIALSTTEAEYMSITAAAQEGLWLKRLEKELFPSTEDSFIMFCDNQSAIALASTANFNPRTKHIDIKYHFIRELLNNKRLKIKYTNTNSMLADFLTKTVSPKKHVYCSEALGVK